MTKRIKRDHPDYYTVNRIESIIAEYHVNASNIDEIRADIARERELQHAYKQAAAEAEHAYQSSVLLAVSARERIRSVETSRYWSGVLTDMKYLHDRIDRVTNPKAAIVLHMRMDGTPVVDIARRLNMDRSHIYRLIRLAAKQIKGSELAC